MEQKIRVEIEKLRIGDIKMDFIREELNEECGIKIMNYLKDKPLKHTQNATDVLRKDTSIKEIKFYN